MVIYQLHKVEYKQHANRVQISCDILRLFAQLVFLHFKKAYLTSRLYATVLYPLCFSRLMRNEEKDLTEKGAVG